MRIHVGAYAAREGLELDAEGALYDGLEGLGVDGIENPFDGKLHQDEGWLAAQIRPAWTIVVTTLPGVMARLKEARHFGLASADEDGRLGALAFLEEARLAIGRMNGALGRRAVAAVMIHSAPRLGASGAKASVERFADSLTELRGRDWQGAALLLEHCDAAIAGQLPDKGFLRIEDDALAVKLSSGTTPLRLAINWGRSAVETRSAEGPLAHIQRASQSDLLGALFFSGAIASHPEYGEWRDSHAPFSTTLPGSLLTPAAAKECLEAAPGCPIVGLKLQTRPASLSVAQRLSVIEAGMNAIMKP